MAHIRMFGNNCTKGLFMIENIQIQGFKSYLDQPKPIELGLVNVFIGPNGSGKSNLLEAVGLMGSAAWGLVEDQTLLYRGVRPGVERLYKSGFKVGTAPQKIDLFAASSKASYRAGLYIPAGASDSKWAYKTESVYLGEDKISGYSPRSSARMGSRGKAALERQSWSQKSPASVLLDDLAGYCIYSPNTQTLRNLVQDPQNREPVGLSGGRLAEAVQEMIEDKDPLARKVFNDIFGMIGWASSFGAKGPGEIPLSRSVATTGSILGFKDRYLKPDQSWLSGYDASEGALYLLFTAVLVLHPKSPRFFAIDNADHGLNPRLAKRLFECICEWSLAAENPRQMLLTTHNPLVLDGLRLQDDRIRLFSVDRDQHGRSIVKRIVVDDKLKKLAEEKGLPLSRLWVMGHLGGIPNV